MMAIVVRLVTLVISHRGDFTALCMSKFNRLAHMLLKVLH